MATIYYQKDCNLSLLEGKTIAIIGYGSQGHARTQRNLDAMSLLVCTRDPSLGQRQKQKDLKYIQQQRLLREQILS